VKNEIVHEEVLQSSLEQIAPGEIIIGTLQGLTKEGEPLINFAGNVSTDPIIALSTVALKQHHSGRQVALLFAQGELSKPVIIGLIHSPLHEMLDSFETDSGFTENKSKQHASEPEIKQVEDVYLDGKRVVFEGKEEIVLKCGDASITLTKAGKILIRGKFISNRSSGVNRLLGASIQIN
jgi:hypothetical protein